ncbi:hypothetical protein DL770_003854 [Monosporascus sp. CRB-9-2]|nr:hypothetical protein DL770_003854 [Monosporascus sp. CRB-9-2]
MCGRVSRTTYPVATLKQPLKPARNRVYDMHKPATQAPTTRPRFFTLSVSPRLYRRKSASGDESMSTVCSSSALPWATLSSTFIALNVRIVLQTTTATTSSTAVGTDNAAVTLSTVVPITIVITSTVAVTVTPAARSDVDIYGLSHHNI